jgi:hypothetical protein
MEFAIVAMQRSGTGVLTAFLNTHSEFFVLREVFNPDGLGLESFNTFLAAQRLAVDMLTRLDSRAPLFGEYLSHVAAMTGRPHVGFNVKYSSCHHLDGDWKDHTTRPHLLDFMSQRRGRILHLVRRNTFLQALSLSTAEHTGVWHITDDAERTARLVEIDVGRLTANIRQITRLTSTFETLLDDDCNALKLYYEDLFDHEGAFAPTFIESVAAFLGVNPSGFCPIPSLLKIAPANWRDGVANWQEVEKAVTAAGFVIGLAAEPDPTSARACR